MKAISRLSSIAASVALGTAIALLPATAVWAGKDDHLEARELLKTRKIERVIVVDEDYRAVGLITMKDIEKAQAFPNAAKDEQGRLLVGAASTVGDAGYERAMALADFTITLNRLKVIVLMVLWQQEEPIDTLMIDELLTEEDDWGYEPIVH